MGKKVVYTGKDQWLQGFDYFEEDPMGVFIGYYRDGSGPRGGDRPAPSTAAFTKTIREHSLPYVSVKVVHYSGQEAFLRVFDYFEVSKAGLYTGYVHEPETGHKIFMPVPLDSYWAKELELHHVDDGVGKERKIDRMKNILESQVLMPTKGNPDYNEFPKVNPIITESGEFLHLECMEQEVFFSFDKTGEKFLGIGNWKD